MMAYPAIRSDLGALVRSDFIRLITRGGSSSDCLLALLRAPSDFGFRTLLQAGGRAPPGSVVREWASKLSLASARALLATYEKAEADIKKYGKRDALEADASHACSRGPALRERIAFLESGGDKLATAREAWRGAIKEAKSARKTTLLDGGNNHPVKTTGAK